VRATGNQWSAECQHVPGRELDAELRYIHGVHLHCSNICVTPFFFSSLLSTNHVLRLFFTEKVPRTMRSALRMCAARVLFSQHTRLKTATQRRLFLGSVSSRCSDWPLPRYHCTGSTLFFTPELSSCAAEQRDTEYEVVCDMIAACETSALNSNSNTRSSHRSPSCLCPATDATATRARHTAARRASVPAHTAQGTHRNTRATRTTVARTWHRDTTPLLTCPCGTRSESAVSAARLELARATVDPE
jgi:hypothetical protein